MTNQPYCSALQPLQQIISEATCPAISAGRVTSFVPVVNNVSEKLLVHADRRKLTNVLRELFKTIGNFGKGTYVHVSAKEYGNVLLLHIKNQGQLNSPQFATSLVPVQQLAEDLTGSVSVTSFRNDVTTVALSFINCSPSLN